jgi:hypothetical protein
MIIFIYLLIKFLDEDITFLAHKYCKQLSNDLNTYWVMRYSEGYIEYQSFFLLI